MFRKPYSPPIFIASFNPMGRMPGDGRALARSYSGESPWFRARQEQLEADVRRTWEAPEPQRRVHGGYPKKRTRVIPFKSRRKNGAGGGDRNRRLGILWASLLALATAGGSTPLLTRNLLRRWYSAG